MQASRRCDATSQPDFPLDSEGMVTQDAEQASSLSKSAGEYLRSSGPMMKTFHPVSARDRALATAATT